MRLLIVIISFQFSDWHKLVRYSEIPKIYNNTKSPINNHVHQKERSPTIWNIEHLSNDLINALKICDPNYKRCVICIPKMVYVSKKEIENVSSVNNNNHKQSIERTEYKKVNIIQMFVWKQ